MGDDFQGGLPPTIGNEPATIEQNFYVGSSGHDQECHRFLKIGLILSQRTPYEAFRSVYSEPLEPMVADLPLGTFAIFLLGNATGRSINPSTG